MTSIVRLRIIKIEGDADALLPLVACLVAQDGRYERGQSVRSNGAFVSAEEIPAADDRPLSPQEFAADNGHAHHWFLDTPNGPTSIGRCSCGAVQEMRNSVPERVHVDASKGPRKPAARVGHTERPPCPACDHDRMTKLHHDLCGTAAPHA